MARMFCEEKFRSLVRLFWILPLVTAPSLIMWGYYEAHRANIVTYGESRSLHQVGPMRAGGSCSTKACDPLEPVGLSRDVPLSKNKVPPLSKNDREDEHLRAQTEIHQLEDRARGVKRKIEKQQISLDILRKGQGSNRPDVTRKKAYLSAQRLEELERKARKLEEKIKKTNLLSAIELKERQATNKPDVPNQEGLPEAQKVEELEEKARNLVQKIKKEKLLLAKLKGEREGLQSIEVTTKICEKKNLAPVGSRPTVSLVSLPGSGNTWVRHLLESASGIYTGSVYNDKRIFRAGFFGEYENPWSGTVIVVKSHRFKPEVAQNFDSAIVLIRNPYKAMISEYNRKLSGRNHTAVANQTDFSGDEWQHFIHEQGEKWVGIIEKWLAKDPTVLIIYYEDVLRDTRTELGKMLKFLDVDINPARMDCTIANQEGSFHRNSTHQFDPFSSRDRKYVNQRMDHINEVLSLYGKPALPEEYRAEVLR